MKSSVAKDVIVVAVVVRLVYLLDDLNLPAFVWLYNFAPFHDIKAEPC